MKRLLGAVVAAALFGQTAARADDLPVAAVVRLERKVEDLEKRVAALEAKTPAKVTTGIKTASGDCPNGVCPVPGQSGVVYTLGSSAGDCPGGCPNGTCQYGAPVGRRGLFGRWR